MNRLHLIKLILSLILFTVASACAQSDKSIMAERVAFAKPGYLAINHHPASDDEVCEKWGLIDYDGNMIFDGESKWVMPIHNSYSDFGGFPYHTGFTVFGEQGKGLGVTNKDNAVVVKPIHKDIKLVGDYCLTEDSKPCEVSVYYLPTSTVIGKFQPKFSIEDVLSVSEGKILVKHPDEAIFSFYDLKGNMIITPEKLKKYYWVNEFHEGLAAVFGVDKDDADCIGYINEKGEEVIKPQFRYDPSPGEEIHFSNGRAIVLNNEEKYGAIDKTGKVVIPFIYRSISAFQNGKALAEYETKPDEYKTKWIDINGNDTTPDDTIAEIALWPEEDDKTGLYGYYNRKGEMVIQPAYEKATHFVNGHALVKKDGKVCLIDTSGKIILDNIAKEIWYM